MSKEPGALQITNTINRVDRDIANEMCIDFGLRCDFYNPVSVVGCLKYYEKVKSGESTKVELQRQRAKEQLIHGVDPYAVADPFEIGEGALFQIVREVEAEGHFVEGL